MDIEFVENIKILNEYMNLSGDVEYAGVSCKDDFNNYKNIINFKYKMINPKKQFNKMCDFITKYKEELNYDWFIKIRPNVKLLEPINFNSLINNSINGRARVYKGPKKIMYGISVGGIGYWEQHKEYSFNENELEIILDDQLYIFDKNVIINNGFYEIINYTDEPEHEWFHTNKWKERSMNLNVIGINMIFMYSKDRIAYSGNINMNLEELVDNTRTDKNTVHSYLPLYQKLLISKMETAKNVLEVGIWNGGSIKLWNDFFKNANVYGLDIINSDNIWECIKNKENIILYTSTDAYDSNFFITNFLNKNIKCDFMLDDGPHTLESMIKFIQLYSQIMTDDGILIIEDVQSWDWIDILKNEVPENLKQFIKIYDLRPNKNRYDDIVFTIDKSNR